MPASTSGGRPSWAPSAPTDDARRLDFSQRLEHIGAALADAVDQQAVAARLTDTEVGRIGSAAVSLWLTGDHPDDTDDPDDSDAAVPAGSRGEVLVAVGRGAGAHFAQRGDDEAWAVI